MQANAARAAYSVGDRTIVLGLLAVFLVVIAAGVLMMSFAGGFGGPMMGYYWGGNWGSMALVGVLVMVVFLGLFLFLLYVLFRGASAPAVSMGGADPVEVARLRYARGELTKAQYDQLLLDLGRTN
ncbi:MAG: hypothetical protein KGJ23_13380 [Euryarchaeota archaeon]|nr:hypothetical protein [Euryarchaeota archaeon]MDE1837591.1 hypothetical protein [Euryarchaeota archaeon]MDE1881244.1 hypothetical protein [Euryarchaeota archaeon]MDE2045902.1 hypothetical protein [Thermoplasmata archaeon]